MASCSAPKQKGDCRCCKTCAFKLPANACEWHQGLIMSGCGKPPGACDFNPNQCCGGDGPSCSCDNLAVKDMFVPDDDLCQPIEKDGSRPFETVNFLYENWIDTCTLTWYVLVRAERGAPLGYNVVLQADSPDVLDAALAGTHARNVFVNAASLNQERSFVFLRVPPSPLVVAGFLPDGTGATLTPDVVLTGYEFGYQVYVRDKRNNRYSRDTYNAHCTEPLFPCDPCDMQCFEQKLVHRGDTAEEPPVGVPYEFDAELCKWFLADFCETAAILAPAEEAECELACCWNRCGKRIGKNPACSNKANQKHCKPCPPPKKKEHKPTKCCH